MTRVSRKEILDDPNWIKFQVTTGQMSLYEDVLREHNKHLCLAKKYQGSNNIFMLECWTCRVIYFFHNKDDYNEIRKITKKEHWLYNDFPEDMQHLLTLRGKG